ncbi:Intraflagellar transport protein 81 [Trebouxia sp. C0010 RCD-2024]
MDLQRLVAALNKAPYNYGLTAVGLSSKPPHAVLQLLDAVVWTFSRQFKAPNTGLELVEQTAARICKFLSAVKCPISVTPESLYQGDKEYIFQILEWLFDEQQRQPGLLHKRAFVGFYLSSIDLPSDVAQYLDVQQLYQEVQSYQQLFVDLHRATTANTPTGEDPAALTAKLLQLDGHKQQLQEKLSKIRGKLQNVANLPVLQKVCEGLRVEREEQAALQQQMEQQQAQLAAADEQHAAAQAQLTSLRLTALDGSSDKLLEQVQQEVSRLQSVVADQLPKEKQRQQQRIQAISQALETAASPEVVGPLHQRAQQLQADIQAIMTARAAASANAPAADNSDKLKLQLRQAQQMAAAVARKKEDMIIKLKRLTDTQARLEAADAGRRATPDGTELQASIKAKRPAYMDAKAELAGIESQVLALAHEQDTISMSGASSVVGRGAGGAHAAIKQQKAQLASLIARLRTQRQACQDLEMQQAEQKPQRSLAGSVDTTGRHLQQDLMMMRQQLQDEEARLQQLGESISSVKQKAALVSDPEQLANMKAR